LGLPTQEAELGIRARQRQMKLPKKLKAIREALGLSQNEIIKALDLTGLRQSNISDYEMGKYEPPIFLLLAYSRAANICADVLLDDDLDLPKNLPPKKTYHPH
jgi:transcriptional regulator with XRE-family HTH domain